MPFNSGGPLPFKPSVHSQYRIRSWASWRTINSTPYCRVHRLSFTHRSRSLPLDPYLRETPRLPPRDRRLSGRLQREVRNWVNYQHQQLLQIGLRRTLPIWVPVGVLRSSAAHGVARIIRLGFGSNRKPQIELFLNSNLDFEHCNKGNLSPTHLCGCRRPSRCLYQDRVTPMSRNHTSNKTPSRHATLPSLDPQPTNRNPPALRLSFGELLHRRSQVPESLLADEKWADSSERMLKPVSRHRLRARDSGPVTAVGPVNVPAACWRWSR